MLILLPPHNSSLLLAPPSSSSLLLLPAPGLLLTPPSSLLLPPPCSRPPPCSSLLQAPTQYSPQAVNSVLSERTIWLQCRRGDAQRPAVHSVQAVNCVHSEWRCQRQYCCNVRGQMPKCQLFIPYRLSIVFIPNGGVKDIVSGMCERRCLKASCSIRTGCQLCSF